MDKRKLAAAVSGLVLIGGLSAGAAWAQSGGPVPSSLVQGEAGQPAATSPDPDRLQQGDQTSPDVPGQAEPNEQAESKEGVEQETKGAEEPGDEKLPGGGHADPDGQNVDHQFEGVE
jgi:hypothetical protein